MNNIFRLHCFAAFLFAALCASAQSSFRDLMNTASATMDAARESREQNTVASDVRAIFAKAKEAEDDGNVNFCGFYVGMTKSDADALVAHYGLKDGESKIKGDPVYAIQLSLKGVRRITKGGNSYEELCQAVANRVGNMSGKSNWSGGKREEWYEYKTIDGVRVTMAEVQLPNANIDAGFTIFDMSGDIFRESEARTTAENARRRSERLGRRAEQLKTSPAVTSVATKILASMVQIPGKNYKLGKTEVTQAQWEAIMGENPSSFKGEDNPVDNVSWDDCQDFISLINQISVVKESRLTFRLPTDDEWVFASRGGTFFGGDFNETEARSIAWFDDTAGRKTHPVGQMKPNAFGLYDMFGNVREWCENESNNSLYRICRGGSWHCSVSLLKEYYSRDEEWYGTRRNDLGFRLCAFSSATLSRQAAESGDAEAQWRLGVQYLNGRDVEQSDAEAASWFRKAAEKGNTEGQNLLG